MGSILVAKCPCGFEPEPIFAGGGMMEKYRTICLAPALCLRCESIVTANYWDEDARCPHCRGRVKFYDDPNLQASKEGVTNSLSEVFAWGSDNAKRFVLSDKFFYCPRCGEFKMEFRVDLPWD
ncbi:MAG: hypothetical protein KC944_05080 [Candidatus Omnitrophica bacterium]|nr:hypothetical protein [Candidatus Omnitrophota bacterium]MCA9424442.1 hypothetical protein [Candidatus Omnitrophota bacterium]